MSQDAAPGAPCTLGEATRIAQERAREHGTSPLARFLAERQGERWQERAEYLGFAAASLVRARPELTLEQAVELLRPLFMPKGRAGDG